MLSPKNTDFRPDDLQKIPIFFNGEQDGVFNNNDYILFYGEGPDDWNLTYHTGINKNRWFPSKHFYSDSAYYYVRIDDSSPLRIQENPEITASATHIVNQYQDYAFVENELVNLGKAGREFYGEALNAGSSVTYNFNFTQLTGTAFIEFNAAVQSVGQNSTVTYNLGGQTGSVSTSPVGGTSTSNYANLVSQWVNIAPTGSSIPTSFGFTPGNADAQAWTDYVSVNVTRNMVFAGTPMRLRDTTAIAPGAIAEYVLTNATNVSQVWDITSPPIVTGKQIGRAHV